MKNIEFPSLRTRVDALWMPLLLRPFIDSPERLVIGVAAVSKDSFHLEKANDLGRLECLLGARSLEVVDVARLGLRSFEKQLAQLGPDISQGFRAPLSGILLGSAKEAVGPSLQEISMFWLSASSSLHQNAVRQAFELAMPQAIAVSAKAPPPAAEVVRQVLNTRPLLAANFRPHFVRGRRIPAHKNDVDYKSEAMVANIDFIAPNFTAPTVNRIVKRMWDLEIDRGINDNVPADSHEMLVEIPERDEMTRAETDKLQETVQQLTWQADQRRIRFRPLPSAQAISQIILAAEAA